MIDAEITEARLSGVAVRAIQREPSLRLLRKARADLRYAPKLGDPR